MIAERVYTHDARTVRSELTRTFVLARSIVRRDRIRIVVWIASIVALVAITAASVEGLFPTQASLDRAAAASRNAAIIAFNGPAQGLNTIGGEVAFQVGAVGMVVVALMSLFMIGRLTRGEEEAGRLELIRSLPVGQHAPTVAASLVVALMNLAAGGLTSLVLIAQGLPIAGSLVFGASYVLLGLLFAAIALVVAQVTENTRVVYGATGALLAAAFIIRAIGDIGDGTVSWFSPIGIAQKTRPFARERLWPFLILLAATALLVALTRALATRRDLDGGLVAPRAGRSEASPRLGSPLGLAARLQRGSLIGWSLGVLVTGVAYGTIATSVDAYVSQNKQLADLLAGPGRNLTDSYLATSFRVVAILATGFSVQSAMRLRSEETSLHAESVLATPVSRWRWAASHLTVALLGSVVLLLVAGLAMSLSYAAIGGGVAVIPRVAVAALPYAPAMWVFVGATVALIGLVPRASIGSWGLLALCFVIGFLGTALHFPAWTHDASPFQRVPQLPAAHMTISPLIALTAIAAACTLLGLGALRRRDIE